MPTVHMCSSYIQSEVLQVQHWYHIFYVSVALS